MNKSFLTLTLLTGFTFFTAPATAETWPREVDIAAESLFVPAGFDDNDETMVILDGYLPSACHRLTAPTIQVDAASKKIVVGARAKEFKGVCPDVTVPFTQTVTLGQLERGDYAVVSKDGKHTNMMQISHATAAGPDDYLYAMVEKAHVIYPVPHKWVAVIEGRFTNTCLGLEETKVTVTGNTIQVLPIMNFVEPTNPKVPCRAQQRPFRTVVELPHLPADGRYLLHVRSLNGQAVNEVFFRTTPQP